MAQKPSLVDRLSNAAASSVQKAQTTAQQAIGVIGEDEQAKYALSIAQKNPEAFIAIMQRLFQEDPQTAMAILKALLRNIDPQAAEEVIQALSAAMSDGWSPNNAPMPPAPAPAPGQTASTWSPVAPASGKKAWGV